MYPILFDEGPTLNHCAIVALPRGNFNWKHQFGRASSHQSSALLRMNGGTANGENVGRSPHVRCFTCSLLLNVAGVISIIISVTRGCSGN